MALLSLQQPLRPAVSAPPRLRRNAITGVVRVIDEQVLVGACQWPFDPFFRPTIGLLIDGQLQKLFPTRRVPAQDRNGNMEWRNAFEIEIGYPIDGLDGVELVCLETGCSLYSSPRTRPGSAPGGRSAPLDIADLIALSHKRLPEFDGSGFRSFLRLSISDQIDLVYHAVLGRSADSFGLSQYIDQMKSGSITILGIRDKFLASDEFLGGRFKTVGAMLGSWIVWGGLNDVAQEILSSNGDGIGDSAPAFETWPKPRDATAYLARVALGEGAERDVVSNWTKDNGAAITEFGASLKRAQLGGLRPAGGGNQLDLGNLLDSMRVGAAGQKQKNRIDIRPGQSGDVVFGPYARLEPGRYRLSALLHVGAASGSEHPRLIFEVIYGEILVTARIIGETEFSLARHTLEFEVPAGMRALAAPRFEFRLRSDGFVEGELIGLNLARLGNPSSGGCSWPKIENWLPIMNLGDAGQRAEQGILGKSGVTGHVFYGPYRGFLPGKYLVELSFSNLFDGSGAVAPVLLEVVTGSGITLGTREVAISKICNKAELLFEVPGVEDIGSLSEPLEIRLHKLNFAPFEVLKLTISPLRSDVENG